MSYKDPDKAKAYFKAHDAVRNATPSRGAYLTARNRSPKVRAYEVARRLAKFKLTPIDFNRMIDTQDHVCMICGWVREDETGKAKTLHVDHSHASNKVRGLLCETCNKGLGLFKDQAALLRKAAAYLDHFTFIDQTESSNERND